MQFVYACELKLEGDPNRAFEDAQRLVKAWQQERVGVIEMDDPSGEVWTAHDVMVQWRSLGAAPARVWRYVIEHPGQDDDWVWRTTVWVVQQAGGTSVIIRVGLVATDTKILEPNLVLRRPRIVGTLIDGLDVHADGRRLRSAPLRVDRPAIGQLERLVTDPDRHLPVVVVTNRSKTGSPVVSPTELARQLAGLAHIVYLTSGAATYAWTDVVGRQAAVFDGGVRLYWPRFSVDSPDSSVLWLATTIERISARLGFANMVLRRLGQTAVLAIPRPPLESRLRTLADQERRSEIERRLNEARSVGDNEQWLESFDEILDHNETLEARVRELEDENAALRRNFGEVTLSLATSRRLMEDAHHDAHAAEPTSVAEAVDWIEELSRSRWYAAKVVVEPSALRTARSFGSYRRPTELIRAAQAVLEAGALYADDRMGEPPMDFFARRGFGYGARPGPHLKVDESTSPDQCLRIYWEVDEASRTWRVISIGEHA